MTPAPTPHIPTPPQTCLSEAHLCVLRGDFFQLHCPCLSLLLVKEYSFCLLLAFKNSPPKKINWKVRKKMSIWRVFVYRCNKEGRR